MPCASSVSSIDEQELEPRAEAAARKSLDDLDDALGPRAYWRAPTWKRVAAIAAGPAANVLLAIVVFTVLFMTSAGKATTTVDHIAENSPAATAGLRAGDRLVSINGTRVAANDVSRLISGSGGEPVTVVVARGGELMHVAGNATQSAGRELSTRIRPRGRRATARGRDRRGVRAHRRGDA